MIKKSHPKFNVPNFGARSRKRVQARWRKQRGIDNKKRTKKSFMGAEPNIGYGNPESIKGIRASGKRLVLVYNAAQLNSVDPKGYEVAIAHGVAKRKRAEIVTAASKIGVRVVNSGIS